MACGIPKLNIHSVPLNRSRTDRGGYGKIDTSALRYHCQPMPGGNCIPKVSRTAASGATGRLLRGTANSWIADAKINIGRDARGGWRRSSKLCVDRVLQRDSCSSGVNW